MTGLRFPKPRPHALTKLDRAADQAAVDRRESANVKARSFGRCEVIVRICGRLVARCLRPAAPGNHHLIGGSGKRNRGRSILAEHRLATCARCHRDITDHVLIPCVSRADAECADRVKYERVR